MLEKLVVTHLVKIPRLLQKTEVSMSLMQEAATGPYTEPDESNPHFSLTFALLLKYSLFMSSLPYCYFSPRFLTKILFAFVIFPTREMYLT